MKYFKIKILSAILGIILFSNITAYSAAVYVESKTIETVLKLIMKNYVSNISQAEIINGGIKNLNKYLKDNSYITVLSSINASQTPDKQVKNLLDQINNLLSKSKTLKKDTVMAEFVKGAVESLNDQFSVYLSKDEYKKLIEQMEGGNFGGIGIYIDTDKNSGYFTIVSPIDNTPASEAGLKSGDIITKIEGKSTKNMTPNEASKLLRGDIGTPVTITVMSSGSNIPEDVTLIRAYIHMKSLTYKIINNDIGYIKLDIFGDQTSREIEEALNYFQERGVRGYILDLRNNGGGYVITAVEVCSKFLPSMSQIITIEGKSFSKIQYRSFPNFRPNFPVVILVNEYSASASEITAGAFQDHKYAKIIGEKTYGKASVQTIIPLLDGSAIKITTARYLTPNQRDLNKKGLVPDITIKMSPLKIGTQNDVQLKKAIEFISHEIKNKFTFKPYFKDNNYFDEAYTLSELYYKMQNYKNETVSDDIQNQNIIILDNNYYDKITKNNPKSPQYYFDITSFFN